jgi:flagellar basal body-associated protein FliL
MEKVQNSGSKKFLILVTILIAWAVFSVAYIGYDLWSDFKNGQMAQAYQQGRAETVNQLIQRAGQCQPFSVNSGNNQAELISVSCLQQQGQQQGQQQE